MQYRTYKIQELPAPYEWQLPNEDGTLQTYTNKDTLVYASGGAVADYSIDSDYMVANNSTVQLAAETKAVAGQIIALIDDNGAYDLGVVTSVDNENLKILYKSMMELFNVDNLNPTRQNGGNSAENTAVKYLYDGVNDTGHILATFFASANTDRYKRLPLMIKLSGGGRGADGNYNVPAIWAYKDNTLNVRTWLIDLFNKHNVAIQFRLVFEVSRAYIEVYIIHNTTGGRLLKANIHGMTINHTEESAAAATVCQVIDSETKKLLSTWYLLADNTVTSNAADPNRLQPYKLTVAEFDADNEDGATEKTVAEDAMRYSDFNHYVNASIERSSAMFPKNLTVGDSVTLVTEIEEMTVDKPIEADYKNKVWNSIYTGRKESASSTTVTLIFGKIRINYTDLIQMWQAKQVRG